MSSLKLTDGAVTDGVLVLGLSFNPNKASALTIESGTVTIDTRTLLAQLKELGATGKSDEVIKIPGTRTKLILFTGLGITNNNYSHETLRRAAGAARSSPPAGRRSTRRTTAGHAPRRDARRLRVRAPCAGRGPNSWESPVGVGNEWITVPDR